jgi:hypothetical protein
MVRSPTSARPAQDSPGDDDDRLAITQPGRLVDALLEWFRGRPNVV